MFRTLRTPLCFALALLTLSCASSKELARRSAVALQGGDATKAYELALKSIDKDPGNTQARAALYEAAQLRAAEWKRKILDMEQVDSLAAAKEVLAYDDFRLQAARDRAPVDPDPAFDAESHGLKQNAAQAYYFLGNQSLEDDRPKRAYDQFQWAARFDPTRPELDERITYALSQAFTTVAVAPVENQTGTNGLAKRLSDAYYSEINRRLASKDIHFTRLISPSDVRAHAGASWSRSVSPEQAIDIGRSLGARRVVWWRAYALNTDTHTEHFHNTVYHKVVDRDSKDRYRERYVPVDIDVMSRWRTVSVSFEWRVLSVTENRTLAEGNDTRSLDAHTVYTGYQAQGDCGDYYLAPPAEAYDADPGLRTTAGPERNERVRKEWTTQMPEGLELKLLLERARGFRGDRGYNTNQISSFYSGGPSWVFMDDLPPPGELAFAALVQDWQPVYDTLRRLEPLDDPDIQ